MPVTDKNDLPLGQNIGVWLIGANGLIGSAVTAGVYLLTQRQISLTGILTANPPFSELDFCDWGRFRFGGCDLVEVAAPEKADRLVRERILPDHLRRDAIKGLLAAEKETVLLGAGDTVRSLYRQIEDFRNSAALDRVIVVDVSSTRAEAELDISEGLSEDQITNFLETRQTCPLGSLEAAWAAGLAGCGYVNFTPNIGMDHPAVIALFEREGLPHAGKDGRTGETLLKTVLAPMFAERHLHVRSWLSYNMLGNGDGKSLADPVTRAAKLKSKAAALETLLPSSNDRQHIVSIDYVPSLGDWKTAWNFIQFEGFMDVPMSLQFTWSGCDTALAAPLVIDLIRWLERAMRHDERGHQGYLDSYFKSPAGASTHDFRHQMSDLFNYAATRGASREGGLSTGPKH